MAKTIRIRGIKELSANLKQHGADVEAALESITHAAAAVVRQRAAANAGGELGDSILQETTERKPTRVTVAVGPHKDRWYAVFREFGASGHQIRPKNRKALYFGGRFVTIVRRHPGVKADPFLRPAADESGDAALRAAGDEIRKLLP